MKATIMIAEVYHELLDETEVDVVVEANDKIYVGVLFFEPIDEKVVRVIEEKVVNGSVLDIMYTAYGMMRAHGRIGKDDKTFKTMVHWQFLNGFSDDSLAELHSYRYKTDTELFEAVGKVWGL